MTLQVNQERLWRDVMALGDITERDKPYTRQAFTPMFHAGRAWLAEQFEQAGLAVRLDAVGNLIGRLEGDAMARDKTIWMLGSHSDTVLGGGRFDGIAGVLAALEITRTIQEQNVSLCRPLEIVDFLAEEPNLFGGSCVGSRAMAGALPPEMLNGRAVCNGQDITLAEAIRQCGGRPEAIPAMPRRDIHAFFELHIEQGPVLEASHHDIGVVTAIVCIRRMEIHLKGETDHVGTMPMSIRRDAAAAAADVMVWIRRQAEGLSQEGHGHFTATVGVVEIQPNAVNVVPEHARLRLDIRSETPEMMDRFTEGLKQALTDITARLRVSLETFHILSDAPAAQCDKALQAQLSQTARTLGYSAMPMASGAGHDAAFLSRIARMAMVFIPCRQGKSHGESEWSAPDALAKGANVILNTLIIPK